MLLRCLFLLFSSFSLLKLCLEIVNWSLHMTSVVGNNPIISMSFIIGLCVCDCVCDLGILLVWPEDWDQIHAAFPLPIHDHISLLMVDEDKSVQKQFYVTWWPDSCILGVSSFVDGPPPNAWPLNSLDFLTSRLLHAQMTCQTVTCGTHQCM